MQAAPQSRLLLVQFDTPPDASTRARLQAAGLRPLLYVPDYAFLVRADGPAPLSAAALPGLRWSGPFQVAYKLPAQLDSLLSAPGASTAELHLLTAKPFLYVFNTDMTGLADDQRKELTALVAPAEPIFLDVKTEAELAELPEDEAAELAAELGLGEPGLDRLAKAGFAALGLTTFLTTGPKETRAWTIRVGATAPEAAGVIHSDFQRGFIKAEIVSYDDLVATGSITAARAAGKARIEGKDYVMQDGDVVEFRFNV